MSEAWPEIVRAVAGRYRSRLQAGFVAGKLRHDPIYRTLFAHPDLRAARSVLDLGCGRGILLAVLAERARLNGTSVALRGLESRASHAALARQALGAGAAIDVTDLRTAEIPAAEAVCAIDVLHYLPREAQRSLLQRIAGALAPGGLLLVREIDRDAGLRGRLAMAAEHAMSALRTEAGRAFAFRSAADWRGSLSTAGFEVEARLGGEGTPFANVLLVGYREAKKARTRDRSARATSSNP
jgi:cyclopropane fatty-acyl-phospholipid synthase-like methyltransferase